MQLPVILHLHPSRRLTLLLLAMHAAALAVLCAVSLSDLMRAGLLLLVICSTGFALQRIHGRERIVRLMLRADGKLEFTRSNGSSGEARPHPHTTVMPQLTLLLFKVGRRIEALPLLSDALPVDDFRQLRLWLRWLASVNENAP